MVVPVKSKPAKTEMGSQRIGNNLNLDIEHNEENLTVIGNNCRINLTKNSGLIKVVGNGCEVNVVKGSGFVEYVGNKGRVNLGPGIPRKNVSYVGNFGDIRWSGDCEGDDAKDEKDTDKQREQHEFTPCRNIVITHENRVCYNKGVVREFIPVIFIPKIRLNTSTRKNTGKTRCDK